MLITEVVKLKKIREKKINTSHSITQRLSLHYSGLLQDSPSSRKGADRQLYK